MTIYARVKSVNIEKFSVDMTCRSSDLADKEGRFGSVPCTHYLLNQYMQKGCDLICSVPKDMYYDHSLSELDRRREEAIFKKPRPSEQLAEWPLSGSV